ncbi:MAG: HNH endonuclease [Promicromonosporaceae bacterium]|nr:HNH endonuclease [Promicromonosporaceae bacterium]
MTTQANKSGSESRTPAQRLGEAVALLRQGVELLTELAADDAQTGCLRNVDFDVLADAEREIRRLESRETAARLCMLPVLDIDGRWALQGARSFPAWLKVRDDVPEGLAKRECRQSRVLRDNLPATRVAALSGAVGEEHVAALVGVCTSQPRLSALAEPMPGMQVPNLDTNGNEVATGPSGEEYLLDQAARFRLPHFTRLTKHFAHRADPQADERGYRDAAAREFLDIGFTLGGAQITGFLTEEHATALDTAIKSIMGAPAAGDDRLPTQRRAQALADLARIALDHGHTGCGAAVRPHLMVTISWEELKRQITTADISPTTEPELAAQARRLLALDKTPATLVGSTGVLPDSLLKRLACDSEITRIVFGPDGQVLNIGRRERTIKGHLRRAVIARDRRCTYPGCYEPPSRCEVHHAVQHWAAHDGDTSIDNAALLCWHHHDFVDGTGITMRWHAANGRGKWAFTHRNGTPIT